MNIQRTILPLLIVVLFSGCSKQFLYSIDYEEKLVINATISPQKGVEVYLSKSLSPNIQTYTPIDSLLINNAIINLYQADTLLEVLTMYGNGFYKSKNTNIVEKNSYWLEVKVDGFTDTYTEEVVVPTAFPLEDYEIFFEEDIAYLDFDFFNSENSPFIAINIYGINLQGGKINISDIYPPYTEDVSLCDVVKVRYNSIFNTDCFPYQTTSIHGNIFYKNGTVLNRDESNESDKLIVSLKNVTQDLFEYSKTYYLEGGFVESLFTEPSTTYTNIINGYGIFVGENSITFEYNI